jgi:hypothetical protein
MWRLAFPDFPGFLRDWAMPGDVWWRRTWHTDQTDQEIMAFQPQFEDIPEHLRQLATGVPNLKRPIWYAGAVYGNTAKGLEDATAARSGSNGIAADENALHNEPEQPSTSTSSDEPEDGVVSSQTSPNTDGD